MLGWLAAYAPPSHAGSWQTVGSLTEGRNYPRATLLTDGTVLVTGGQGSKGGRDFPLRSAERFDPKTNTFTALPPMSVERMGQAAVRLQDGRVLVLGGVGPSGSSHNTAELFDPTSGTFVATGRMSGRRMWPTVNLLPDGRVLVVGGWTSFVANPVKTAEIYDPATGTFQPTGSMAEARAAHHAFSLPDGRVLVLGGFGTRKNARGVEIYDPATGAFSPGGELAGERDALASAVRLADGRILLAGGESTAPNGNKRLDNTIEIYDPATGTSAMIGTLAEPREEHISILLPDGRVLAAGGWAIPVSVARARASAEVIDPATGKATLIEPMAAGPRANAGVVRLLDGRVLVLGGIYPGGHRLPAEVYLP
jgi:hypothetical protein